MDELESKIEELLKGLFALKEQQGHFVPTPKPAKIAGSTPTALKSGAQQAGASLKLPSLPGDLNTIKVSKPPAPQPIPGGSGPDSKKDPAKMAEQLKNPHPVKPNVEVLKVESNGQWSLMKQDLGGGGATTVPPANLPSPALNNNVTKPARVSASLRQRSRPPVGQISSASHGWTTNAPHQHALIDGLSLDSAKHIGEGKQGAAFATSPLHPHTTVVKNSDHHGNRIERGHTRNGFNSARREVLYHDLAHGFFGLGQHVPTTAGFTHMGADWSAQHKVNNASHAAYDTKFKDPTDLDEKPEIKLKNPNHARVLSTLNDSGQLDKLAIMDHLSGHHDRHRSNYLLDDEGDNLHLIDNGTAFDYGNLDSHPHPHYRAHVQDRDVSPVVGHDSSAALHPEAVKWLQGLKASDAANLFAAHGHNSDSPAVKGFMQRLMHLQDAVKRPQDFKRANDMFVEGREFSNQEPGEYI